MHECLHGTHPTATPANTVLPDTDGDGMYDAWELNNRLDPDDSADASLDDDGDGHTNLEEFTARTDPQWEDSNPDSIPELQFGFNDSYTVEVGMINSGDMLNDILIRNPATGILPSVTDFVLIQKRGGGFDIKDPVAEGYTIPTTLTDITSKATVVDINGDGVKDLVLTGLDSGTATITGADDQVVYGNYYERYSIPEKHIALTATRKKFFEDLSAWIENANYFEVDVPVSTTLDIDEAENTDEIQNRDYTPDGFSIFGIVNLTDLFLLQNTNDCIGLSPVLCYVLSSDGFSGGSDPFLLDNIHIAASGGHTIRFSAAPGATNRPTTVNIYDTSGFDQDARMLALYYLQPIRESGSLQPGATNSKVISEMLEAILGVPVLNNSLLGIGNGVVPNVEDHTSYTGIAREMIQSVEFQRDRMALPAPQVQITDEERNNSPNLDVLDDLPDCDIIRRELCNEDSFTDEQQDAIRTRIDELSVPLQDKIYSSADEAAIALHESDLVAFSFEIGIEIFAIIHNLTTRIRIIRVGTNFRTNETGEMGEIAEGLDTWHTHTSGRYIAQPDASQTAKYNSDTICIPGVDHTTYVSGVRLSKANAKQMIDISDPGDFVFRYMIHRQELWQNETRPGTGAADLPEFTCNP